MTIFDRIPTWVYVVALSAAAYHFIAGFLDSMP